jgi:hypothetical protein
MSTNLNEVELLQEELDWWKSQLKEAAKVGDWKYVFEAKNSIFDVEAHLENIHKIAAAGRDGWDSILWDS